MIYNLSNKKEGVHFEKKFPTTVGGTANIGGFFEDDNRYIFVEAKCHEPYTLKNVTVSKCGAFHSSREKIHQYRIAHARDHPNLYIQDRDTRKKRKAL